MNHYSNEMEKFFPKCKKINSKEHMDEHLFPNIEKIIMLHRSPGIIALVTKRSIFPIQPNIIKNKPYIFHELKLQDKKSSIKSSTLKLIKHGKYPIDSRIDLHGCILEDAYNKFLFAIKNSYENHHKLILVITGKGLDHGEGLIKNNLLNWINNNHFLNEVILYISYAKSQHGGEGAFYLYLKK